MSKIGDLNIIISNYIDASNEQFIKDNAVTTIIDIGNNNPTINFSGVTKYSYFIKDEPKEPINKYFEEIYNIINNNKGITLVNCHAGISRSPTVVAYYIMKKFNKDTISALLYIKRYRNIINPNYGFTQQLDNAYLHIF